MNTLHTCCTAALIYWTKAATWKLHVGGALKFARPEYQQSTTDHNAMVSWSSPPAIVPGCDAVRICGAVQLIHEGLFGHEAVPPHACSSPHAVDLRARAPFDLHTLSFSSAGILCQIQPDRGSMESGCSDFCLLLSVGTSLHPKTADKTSRTSTF